MGFKGFSGKIFFLLSFLLVFGVSFPLAVELTKIQGKIKNENGKAISGAKVQIEEAGKVIATTTTNNKGEFSLSIELKEYTISVEADGYQSARLSSESESGKKTNVELVLAEAFALVRGTVFTERGFSFPNALVLVETINSNNRKKFIKQYTTNQSGEFAFRLPNTGEYLLTASAKGYITESKKIEVNLGEARNLAFSLIPEKK